MAQKPTFLLDQVGVRPQWFIDLGVGRPGTEAADAAKLWKGVNIIGVEPDAERYQTLHRSFPGRLLRCLVGSRNRVCNFYVDPAKKWFTCFPDPARKAERRSIHCATLDSIEKQYGPFRQSFLWADIEGSELDMLSGATNLLASGRLVALQLEVRHRPPSPEWCTREEVEAFLARFDYRLFIEGPRQLGRRDVVYVHESAPVLLRKGARHRPRR